MRSGMRSDMRSDRDIGLIYPCIIPYYVIAKLSKTIIVLLSKSDNKFCRIERFAKMCKLILL